MAKYRVYGLMTASKFVGEFEANSEEEAQEMAAESNPHVNICHQCSSEIDLDDIYKFDVEKIS